MNKKIGRNDLCPCGSGKKYKSCCMLVQKKPSGTKKFTAKLLSNPNPVNLIERTFGSAIEAAEKNETKSFTMQKDTSSEPKPS